MAVAWTRHRFSGGVLALDVTNTVVHRGHAEKSFDRFDEATEIARFAQAASLFRADELGGVRIGVDDAKAIRPTVLAIRESSDRLFRARAADGGLDVALLPDFLRACAEGFDALKPGRQDIAVSFERVLATSALSLLPPVMASRIRICPNCNWLFLDKSRNSSRLWCDMAVCGNRSKVQRHYRRRRQDQEETENA